MSSTTVEPKVPEGKLVPWSAKAQEKGISVKTLDRWVAQGLIDPPIRINNRKYSRDQAEA
jgi:DNA-binding transcriptional MerR regulator